MKYEENIQTEPQFNGIFSRNNLSKIKDRAYTRNLDEYESLGTHQVALYMNAENVTYVDRFGVKNLLEIKILQQIFIKCKHTIQWCVDNFVLDLLISF